jgi:hypothetical protein
MKLKIYYQYLHFKKYVVFYLISYSLFIYAVKKLSKELYLSIFYLIMQNSLLLIKFRKFLFFHTIFNIFI